MPIYTYRAPCGHTWDEVRPIEGSETSEAPCPVCTDATSGPGRLESGQALPQHGTKTVPTGVSAHFKGTGWTPRFHNRTKGNK